MSSSLMLTLFHAGGSPVKINVRVTLRLAVYRLSIRLGVKPFEVHDHIFFFGS
jgi:hypothetical protein